MSDYLKATLRFLAFALKPGGRLALPLVQLAALLSASIAAGYFAGWQVLLLVLCFAALLLVTASGVRLQREKDARGRTTLHLGVSSLGLESGDVAEVLGHTSPTITERIYVHAFDRAKREERVRSKMAEAMGEGT